MKEIKTNKMYKHFKGNFYKVIYIGQDSETAKEVVVYESKHDGKIWVRPLENFASKVDFEKYPNATQEYRFEEVD